MKRYIFAFLFFCIGFVLPVQAKFECDPAINIGLSEDYVWYILNEEESAERILNGNLRETFSLCTQKFQSVRVIIDNYASGRTKIFISNSDTDDNINIFFDKDSKERLLNGQDIREGWLDQMKVLVYQGDLYLGYSKIHYFY